MEATLGIPPGELQALQDVFANAMRQGFLALRAGLATDAEQQQTSSSPVRGLTRPRGENLEADQAVDEPAEKRQRAEPDCAPRGPALRDPLIYK